MSQCRSELTTERDRTPAKVSVVTRARELWSEEQQSVCAVAVAVAVYVPIWWSGATLIGGDSYDYQAVADALLKGTSTIPDRVPGYPLFLILTGAVHSPARSVFIAQLLLHCMSVLLIATTARHLGVGRHLRLCVTVLLLLPPVVAQTRFMMSETLAELMIVTSVWLFTRWTVTQRSFQLLALGGVIGLAAWIRPTYTAWFAVAGIVVWLAARSRGRSRKLALRQSAMVGLTGFAIVALLAVSNLVRFGYATTTPLLPWNLSTRTVTYIDDIEGEDAARDYLVSVRNESLVNGTSHTGLMYIWTARSGLEAVTGTSGQELDRFMLRLNLRLIAAHPLRYMAEVTSSAGTYILLESPEEADFGFRPTSLVWLAIHLMLVVVFIAQFCVTAGLAALGRLSKRLLWPLSFCYSLMLYNLAISTMIEVGWPRYRLPTDAITLMAIAVGVSAWKAVVRDREPAASNSLLDAAD